MLTKKDLLEVIADMSMDAPPKGGKKRRSSRRYCLQGKYYRSKKKLYDALHEIECNI